MSKIPGNPSVRTLSRRLSGEGTTFAAVVDELRRSLALEYLKEPGFTLSQIAWLLGYESPTSFNHAFKRLDGPFAIRRPIREATISVGIDPAVLRSEQDPPSPSVSLASPSPPLPQLRGCTFRQIVQQIALRGRAGKCCLGCVAEGRGLNHRSVPQARHVDARLAAGEFVENHGNFDLTLELDQRERRTVGRCLLACRSRLIETIGDTTRTAASRRIGSRQLELVESVLRKLRLFDHTHHQPQIDAD